MEPQADTKRTEAEFEKLKADAIKKAPSCSIHQEVVTVMDGQQRLGCSKCMLAKSIDLDSATHIEQVFSDESEKWQLIENKASSLVAEADKYGDLSEAETELLGLIEEDKKEDLMEDYNKLSAEKLQGQISFNVSEFKKNLASGNIQGVVELQQVRENLEKKISSEIQLPQEYMISPIRKVALASLTFSQEQCEKELTIIQKWSCEEPVLINSYMTEKFNVLREEQKKHVQIQNEIGERESARKIMWRKFRHRRLIKIGLAAFILFLIYSSINILSHQSEDLYEHVENLKQDVNTLISGLADLQKMVKEKEGSNYRVMHYGSGEDLTQKKLKREKEYDVKVRVEWADLYVNPEPWFNKADPYTVIEFEGNRYQTKVHSSAGKLPVWNQQLHLGKASESARIHFKVYDKDWKIDDFIGSTFHFPLSDMCDSAQSRELTLWNAGKHTGILSVYFTCR